MMIYKIMDYGHSIVKLNERGLYWEAIEFFDIPIDAQVRLDELSEVIVEVRGYPRSIIFGCSVTMPKYKMDCKFRGMIFAMAVTGILPDEKTPRPVNEYLVEDMEILTLKNYKSESMNARYEHWDIGT